MLANPVRCKFMLIRLKAWFCSLEITHCIVVFLAVALQIQITLFAKGDYLGLRVGLGDLFLPFVGLFVVFSLIYKKTLWPRWSVRFTVLWLSALVLVMSVSLLNGYIVNGFLSSWAFVNKYTGFFLLLSYFALGGWIVTNARDASYVLRLFMVVFTGFFVLTVLASAIALFLQHYVSAPLWLAYYPWDGFMANRNAFMVIFVLSFVFMIWRDTDPQTLIPSWIHVLFWMCLPVFFIFNDSRTGWIISAILGVIFFSKDFIRRGKQIVPLLLAGILIVYISYHVTTYAVVLEGRQARYLLALVHAEEDLDYMGDQKRFIAVEDGLALYRAHDPLVGAGLGAYKPFQIAKRGEFIDVMDFTVLWLLAETGAVGLLVFIAFFIACIWSLYKAGYGDMDDDVRCTPYYRAMFVFLTLFAIISVLHEVLYTRVLWFSMGLALAVPRKSLTTLGAIDGDDGRGCA